MSGLFCQDSRKIVGVKRSTPIEIERLRIGQAEKVEIGLIDEFPFAVGSGHPDQHRSAVCYGAEPRLAFGDLSLGDLSLRDVADHDVHAEGAARSVAMRDVNDLCRQRAGRTDKIDFVGHALAGQRALQIGAPRLVHRRAHDFVHPPAKNGAQRAFEPGFVRLVGEAKNLVLVDVGDEHRKGVGDRAELLFALQRFLLGEFPVGDVDMRADQGDRRGVFIAFNFSDGPDPAHCAVARANDAVFRLVLGITAGDDAQKVLNRPRPVVRMDAARPILVGFDARIRRQAVQAQIFGRPVTGEAAGEVDSHAAEAADLLNSRELEFATTERLEDILPIGRVLECDSDPFTQRKSADLVIAIRPPDRIAFELLFFAVRHRQPITAIEFRPENRRRNLPKQLAEHLLPRNLEHLFGRAIEGDEPPIGVEGEEPFRRARPGSDRPTRPRCPRPGAAQRRRPSPNGLRRAPNWSIRLHS